MVALLINLGLGVARFAGGILKTLRPLAPWILAGVVGALVWHLLPGWGAAARLDRLGADLAAAEVREADWRRAAEGWKESFDQAERLRVEENATAQAAANSLIEQCGARVEEARRSARVIERIVTKEPVYDANRCPVRELVDPDSLREALAGSGTGADRGPGAPSR